MISPQTIKAAEIKVYPPKQLRTLVPNSNPRAQLSLFNTLSSKSMESGKAIIVLGQVIASASSTATAAMFVAFHEVEILLKETVQNNISEKKVSSLQKQISVCT